MRPVFLFSFFGLDCFDFGLALFKDLSRQPDLSRVKNETRLFGAHVWCVLSVCFALVHGALLHGLVFAALSLVLFASCINIVLLSSCDRLVVLCFLFVCSLVSLGQAIILGRFEGGNEETKTAAAYAVGNIAVGNMNL